MFFIFANQYFNKILNFEFNFENEEIIFYYINFVKGICQKINLFPLDIFYNLKNIQFPLFLGITRFFNNKDRLVRTACFNSLLYLFKAKDNSNCLRVIINYPFNLFFVKMIKDIG